MTKSQTTTHNFEKCKVNIWYNCLFRRLTHDVSFIIGIQQYFCLPDTSCHWPLDSHHQWSDKSEAIWLGTDQSEGRRHARWPSVRLSVDAYQTRFKPHPSLDKTMGSVWLKYRCLKQRAAKGHYYTLMMLNIRQTFKIFPKIYENISCGWWCQIFGSATSQTVLLGPQHDFGDSSNVGDSRMVTFKIQIISLRLLFSN